MHDTSCNYLLATYIFNIYICIRKEDCKEILQERLSLGEGSSDLREAAVSGGMKRDLHSLPRN